MRLGLQLYTVRDHLERDVRGTLEEVRRIGYEFVELAGAYDLTPSEWRATLDALGLKASGNHVGVDALENDLDGVVADNKALGNRTLIVPWISSEVYSKGWDCFAERMNALGQKVAAMGMQLAYHNHNFEFEKVDGKNGLDIFYETASPEWVKAEIDAAWVQIGGEDPAGYIRNLKGRVPIVHLKDFDPAQKPQWRAAGQGKVDWDAVLKSCNESGVEFGIVELDESPGDSLEASRQSFEFFRSKGLH